MTGRIAQSFIDRVLDRTDIVDLIDRRVKLKRSGKNYAACCPFHQEKTPSFTVSREKQFYYCFGCGASGNALSFLMDYEHQGFIDALKHLASPLGLDLPDSQDAPTARDDHAPLFAALECAIRSFINQLRHHPQKQRAVTYLKQRGITGDIAREFSLGYAPPGWDHLSKQPLTPELRQGLLTTGLLIERKDSGQACYDAMRDRIIFPIRDFRGRIIGLGGRVLNDDKPKYLNSPESGVFHKGRELYGLYEAKQAGKIKQLLVVEGYMDVIALAQHGLRFAVATLGTATSTTHIERMFRLVDHIIFCFDGDDAGRGAAWKAVNACLPVITDGKRLGFMFLPEGEDPDSLVRREGAAAFAERIQQAEGLADFMFRHQSSDLNLNSLEDKAVLAQRLRPLMEQITAGLYQDMLRQRLSNITGIPETPATPVAQHTPPVQPTVTRRPLRQQNRPSTSLCDKALRLLLQNTRLASELQLPDLNDLPLEHVDLLQAVLDLIAQHPHISTAGMLGFWHGTDIGADLAILAASEFLLPAHDSHQEIADISNRFHVVYLEHRIDLLTTELTQNPSMQILSEQVILRQELENRRRQGHH
ncbi:MAG: DNA primase [Pseudomonadales bacterium]|nr:DNA primase [Pseudomonadales bacterium]